MPSLASCSSRLHTSSRLPVPSCASGLQKLTRYPNPLSSPDALTHPCRTSRMGGGGGGGGVETRTCNRSGQYLAVF
eukprot:757100-Hanusia_phi.AAC.1